MSQHPHRKLERGRKSAQVGKQPFNQPLNKKKSEESAVASDQVKRILNQHIRKKLRKSESQDPQQLRASNTPDSYFEEENPIRRTASEPILKLRPKRSVNSRQNPLQCKTSAPPAVRASDCMEVSFSSAPVYKRSLSPDKRMSHQKPQTYSTSSFKDEFPVHIDVQNPIALSECPAAHFQPLHTQVFTMHSSPILTVPEHCVVMSHRPLSKTQSEPSFIQHFTHIHTQTLVVPHPMYHQQWPQGTFQRHAPKKVPVRSVWPVSPGELERDRQRAREAVSVPSQAPLYNCCSDTPGELHSDEYWDLQNKKYHRKLARVQSTPDTFDRTLPSHFTSPLAWNTRSKPKYTTGLVFDSLTLNRECDCGDISFHREHDYRIWSIWSRLQQCGLKDQCELVKGRLATSKELLSVLRSGLLKTISNSSCSTAALQMAFGSVIELALHVANGELRNGFAVVTPSGHHASHSQTNDSIMFNSVAIAAKQLQDRTKHKKILIVDWDLHHDNETEQMFYTDPNVLYISLHHYDGTGGPNRTGSDGGEGYNVNVAWSGGLSLPIGDAEYLAAFRTVVMPIAREFSPNVVLVSAGFNAAKGHSDSLGGYMVSAKCFGVLTRKLMELAKGRVVLVLEGGHDLISLCDASQACVSALVGNEPEPLAEKELQRSPCANAIESLETVLRFQSRYWHSLSYGKGERRYSAGTEAALVLDGLTMNVPNRSRFPNEPMEHDEDDSM